MPTTFTSRVAVVTGAGSGIGRALALELARRGARLALSDINAETVQETAAMAAGLGAEAIADRLDTSDEVAWAAYAERVMRHYGAVHQLYNNAGIALVGTAAESSLADYDKVLSINLRGVIAGTLTFLPHLIASGAGHVVNISSLNGIVAQPELSHYCTAKFGVRGFSEALRMEMKVAGSPVEVSVVHPGGIATNIATASEAAEQAKGRRSALDQRTKLYNEKLLKMPPERAATIILDGVAKQKMRILVGNDARGADLVARIAPTLIHQPIIRTTRRLSRTMG